MKTQLFVRKCWRVPAFALAFALIIPGCTKEESVVVSTELDKVNNLIAYLHAGDHILYVDPAYQQPVLDELQATEVRPGLFTLPSRDDVDVETVTFFTIAEVSSGNLGQIANELDATGHYLNLPVPIFEFDYLSIRYKVYKNAQCGKVYEGSTTDCSSAANGTSTHDEWLAFSICEKGDKYCLEVTSVIGYEHVYALKNCKGNRQSSTPYMGFMCQR